MTPDEVQLERIKARISTLKALMRALVEEQRATSLEIAKLERLRRSYSDKLRSG